MRFRFCGDLDCPDWVLAEINTLSKMSSVRLRIVVGQIISYCIVGELNYEKILKIAGDSSDGLSDIKGAVAAVHFIVTSAAKYDVEDHELIQEIQQLGMPKENAETVAKQYREHKESLREQLKKDSYRIAKLVDCQWRVDQVLAQSTGTPSQDEKLVNLRIVIESSHHHGDQKHTSSARALQDMSFEVQPAQLDLLVHELSQAQQMMLEMDS